MHALYCKGNSVEYIVRKRGEKNYHIRLCLLTLQRNPYQKQSSRGVLRKSCSENIQQIYKKTPMPKAHFGITLRHGCFSVNLLHIFRTPFPKNTSGRRLLPYLTSTALGILSSFFATVNLYIIHKAFKLTSPSINKFKVYSNYWETLKQIKCKCHYYATNEMLILKLLIYNQQHKTNVTLHNMKLELTYARTKKIH